MSTDAEKTVWTGPRYLTDLSRRRAIITVTAQFAQLVRTRAPLVEGLMAIAMDAPNPKIRSVLLSVRKDIAAGETFHKALENLPRFFPRYYVDLVRRGEQTGNLRKTFEDLELHLVESADFRAEMKYHLGYLTLVLFLEFIIISGLCVFVAPRLLSICETLTAFSPGRDLPFKLQVLAQAGHYVVLMWIVLIIMMGVVVYFYRRTAELVAGRGKYSRIVGVTLLWIPFLRAVFVKRNLTHFCSIAKELVDAGVPLDETFARGTTSDLNTLYRECLGRVAKRLAQGESLKSAMEDERSLLPPTFVELLALGEAGGQLSETFSQLTTAYRREALRTAKVVLDIVAPLGLFMIAAMVYFVYSGFFEGVFALSNLARM